jgi:acetylornithine deacetylase
MEAARLEERAVSLLRELVSIPSVNPLDGELAGAGIAATGELVGEKRVVDYVEHHLRALGIPHERYEVLPFRPNLVACLEGRSAETVALVGHTDTVGIAGFVGDPFSGEVRDGRVHGRGSADAKGPLAAGLLALEMLLARSAPPAVTVLFAAVCDEEYRARGVRKLLRRSAAISRAVVLEPTGLEVVIANNGGARWRVRTHGRAVHSSRAEEGVNAIALMAEVVRVVGEVVNPWLLGREHPLCGTPPANIGSIRGGTNANTVPDLCEAELFVRTHPGEKPRGVVARVNELIRSSLPAEMAGSVEFLRPHFSAQGFFTDPEDPLVRCLLDAADAVGATTRVAGRPYGSDANLLAAKGCRPVVFGPGDDRLAHGPAESVAVSEVVLGAQVLAEALGSTGCPPTGGRGEVARLRGG